MSIVSLAVTEHFLAPDDDCEQVIVDIINYTQPPTPIRFIIFEWTAQRIYDAIKSAHGRQVDVGGLVCYRQSTGAAQRAKLEDLWKVLPRTNITLTMSQFDQITHNKLIWTGWSENTTVNPPVIGLNDTWRTAAQKGVPIVASGSWNWTDVANKQNNTLDVSADLAYIKLLQDSYNKLKAFNLAHHPEWQAESLPLNTGIYEL